MRVKDEDIEKKIFLILENVKNSQLTKKNAVEGILYLFGIEKNYDENGNSFLEIIRKFNK
jgi:hypothetical protein